MNWERVFLVAQHDGPAASPYVLEREGIYLPEHRCWNVNLRGPECGSRLIESIPEAKVYRTREAAEARLKELVG